ncbi:16S rRNA (guanine(527)-N(7))-methyltransferase RsmG [Flavobacteriaceae bacterium Ap0902]|nr:16S rRNA (guanine(527)-N(7))-methyltransferase RsmG [Flavobacteriaceae bacterium Ap0902]
MELLLKYFPNLSKIQQKQFALLEELFLDWNSQINLISRKDAEYLYLRHILHSLAIAKVIEFQKDHKVLDVGTGGGFPGIPLAILFPDTNFHLIDSIGKKIMVVENLVESLDLENVVAEQIRAEKVKSKYHFIVSRAVTQMPKFVAWIRQKIYQESLKGQQLPNGILYLKGGDLTEELSAFPQAIEYPISKYFEEAFFETKKVIYLPL